MLWHVCLFDSVSMQDISESPSWFEWNLYC